ncbi:MAG: hypothetical protein L6Q77_08285 [Bacteroidetes bacterium]|nr:hypothetical protein [Bacteroidota bacterium]
MLKPTGIFLLLSVFYLQAAAGPWKGMAVTGNGRICAVYSDDHRLDTARDGAGLRHLFFRTYEADYLRGTRLTVLKDGKPVSAAGPASVGMVNYHSPQSVWNYPGLQPVSLRLTAYTGDAILIGITADSSQAWEFSFHLRAVRKTNRITRLETRERIPGGILAGWDTGVVLAFTALGSESANWTVLTDSVVSFRATGSQVLAVSAAGSKAGLESGIQELTADPDPFLTADNAWDRWMASGKQPLSLPETDREAYRRNLAAARSANLEGQVPADLTGQFTTQGMPQLYPRDAMMSARVFLETGHLKEARQILEFWQNARIPKKSPGEWYARYSAASEAVDGGDGARFDEPEWDANGYFLTLARRLSDLTGQCPADSSFLFETAGFLCHQIDRKGLLYEGGIIEWTGFLPSTNLTCAAALTSAAELARSFNRPDLAEKFTRASETITRNLTRMTDPATGVYADVRTLDVKASDGTSLEGNSVHYMWGTASLFGILWGYSDHPLMQKTMDWYQKNTFILNGGMQYFTTPDPGLDGYGRAAFFFMTAAAAEYELIRGNRKQARYHLDWLLANSSVYGLMPERIFPDGSDCSEASPLTWCCAETALALLKYDESNR